jgi:3-methyladenine DNA glycosylase AlkD
MTRAWGRSWRLPKNLSTCRLLKWKSFSKAQSIKKALAQSVSWNGKPAITATYYFIRQGDVDDTFKLAEILVPDLHDLVQRAVGG